MITASAMSGRDKKGREARNVKKIKLTKEKKYIRPSQSSSLIIVAIFVFTLSPAVALLLVAFCLALQAITFLPPPPEVQYNMCKALVSEPVLAKSSLSFHIYTPTFAVFYQTCLLSLFCAVAFKWITVFLFKSKHQEKYCWCCCFFVMFSLPALIHVLWCALVVLSVIVTC